MKLDDVKKLHQKKYRTQFGHYLVEGEHLVLELYKATSKAARSAIILYLTERNEAWADAAVSDFKVQLVSERQMTQLSDTKSPQGMIACVPLPKLGTPQKESRSLQEKVIYLHEIQDPGNLGTILRSLAWFGNFTLLLSPNSVDPYNSKVVRSSMGAIFHVPIELDVTLGELNTRYSRFAYLDRQGKAVNTSEFADFDCYLFGNEARGVPRDTLSSFNAEAFTIAGSGAIDSLNLASAVNICVYELSK